MRELGERGRAILSASPTLPIFVSAVSAFEIGQKWRSGRLPELGDPRVSYAALMVRNDFHELAVTADHAMLAGALNGDHRDPFDRFIAAQGLSEGLTIITRDREIASFGCEVLW